MKKRTPILIVIAAASLISLGLIKANSIIPVNAYPATTSGSLPKNLDLNDTEEGAIRDYYSNLNSLSESETRGTNLLKNLKPILKNNQKYFKYDGDSLWALYEITDRDWDKSPASEIAGYNANTNTITGYTYGKSMTNKGSNPYIHALYVNRNVDNQTRAWDDHQQTQWGINQEHIWPKSHGFEDEGEGGARGDPMHLWAGNGRVNGTEHNNFFYGYVDKTKSYIDPVTAKGFNNLSGNYQGISKTMGVGTVFEPQDSDKGDIARSIFYMVARYNNLAGGDTIDSNNPNLELVQESDGPKKGYQSTATLTGKMGVLSDLLEWNRNDPVDEYEIHRNNILYNNYTMNRNPFIDFPQWADIIWGEEKETTSAKPSTDGINGEDLPYDVEKTNKPVTVEETTTLKITTDDSSSINWEITSGSDVVSISATSTNSGKELVITGLKAGTAKITAKMTISGEEYTKTFTINVQAKSSGQIIEGLDNRILFIGGGIAIVVILIVVLLVMKFGSKKTKNKMKKTAKKVVKKATKSSSNRKK